MNNNTTTSATLDAVVDEVERALNSKRADLVEKIANVTDDLRDELDGVDIHDDDALAQAIKDTLDKQETDLLAEINRLAGVTASGDSTTTQAAIQAALNAYYADKREDLRDKLIEVLEKYVDVQNKQLIRVGVLAGKIDLRNVTLRQGTYIYTAHTATLACTYTCTQANTDTSGRNGEATLLPLHPGAGIAILGG